MIEISGLIEQARNHMTDNKMSQAKFAGAIGVSESTFSRWLQQTYPNMDTISEKVQEYLEKEELRRQNVGKLEFVMTNVAKQVWSVLEYTRLQRTIGIIYGDAGIGKTATAKEWAKGKSDVVMITATPAFANPKPFLKLLARAFKTTRTGTMDDVYLDILDKLESRDVTLIIDEAQHLTIQSLEIVRSLNDSTGTAIVMIGNEVVYNKMLGKQKAEFAQLFSRIGMRSSLSTEMLKKEDAAAVFGLTDGPELDYLHSICNSRFGLRGAVHVWVNASNNEDTSLAGLKGMAKQMGILV